MSSDDTFVGTPYRVVARLGKGGMGDVFLAEHRVLSRPVVIKVLRKVHAKRSVMIERMRLEARTLAMFEHPHIVSVLNVGRTRTGRPFVVMERLRGETLGRALARSGPPPPDRSLEYVRQVLSALGAAHQRGIVHRDVKLENIFLHEPTPGEVVVKLLDFGIAKSVHDIRKKRRSSEEALTAEGSVVGTPRYLSPEQGLCQSVDARADLYACGLILYMLLAGRGPFDHVRGAANLVAAHIEEEPLPPSYYSPISVPYRMDVLVLKALAKNPDDRFQTADDFASALNGEGTACDPSPNSVARQSTRRHGGSVHQSDTEVGLESNFARPTSGIMESREREALARFWAAMVITGLVGTTLLAWLAGQVLQ